MNKEQKNQRFFRNSFFPKNHKGADKIISVYWFAVLLIIVGAVVYMALLFYGAPYEIRKMESSIMVNQITDCLSNDGKLRNDFMEQSFADNFLKECRLNLRVEDEYGWKNDQYYVEIHLYDFNDYNSENPPQSLFEISKGNINLKNFAGNSLISSSKSFYVLNDRDEEFIVKVKAVVRKTEKNAN